LFNFLGIAACEPAIFQWDDDDDDSDDDWS